MAGMKMRIANSAEVALGAATAETVLQVVAAAATPVILRGWGISFDGVTATNAPVVVKLVRQSTAGTSGATITPALENGVATYTPQLTANETFSSTEPTISATLGVWEIHPQGGGWSEDFAINEPIIVPGSGRIAIQCTAPDAVNCLSYMKVEE